jgi:hypothetical protein
MSVWFEGTIEINTPLESAKRALQAHDEHFMGAVGFMPGLKDLELVQNSPDNVVIRTNEGLMTRTHITTEGTEDSIVVAFDEEYQAGNMVTANTHFRVALTRNGDGSSLTLVMSGVKAPGVLGFFYRTFGKSSIGNAVLNSYKSYLEQPEG